MHRAADDMEFERAAELRDKVLLLKDMDLGLKPPSRSLLEHGAQREEKSPRRDACGAAQGAGVDRAQPQAGGRRAGQEAALMPSAALEEKLEPLPAAPGVYLMKDRRGEVIYVGKAVNLRSRVRSLLRPVAATPAPSSPSSSRLLGDVETVVVDNEKEALLLENELIKRHQPRFNVLLKDDKNFICLRLDPAGDVPAAGGGAALQARRGACTSGPTPRRAASGRRCASSTATSSCGPAPTTCSDHRKRPCLLYQIGRCPAPCVYRRLATEYRRSRAGGGAVPRGQGRRAARRRSGRG